MKTLAVILGLILGLIIVVPIILYGAFAWGYVATVIYEWFIVSQIDTAPLIEWWQFAGVMFLVKCFVHPTTFSIKSEYKDMSVVWSTPFAAPWLTLFGAWIFKLFIY